MLEDFIQANFLGAKILPYVATGSRVKCRLYSCEKGDILVVFMASDSISKEKLCSALGVPAVKPLSPKLAEEASGYSFEFMPPISIYGVRLVMDKKVLSSEKVKCIVSEAETLVIPPKEILESNEESETAEITR